MRFSKGLSAAVLVSLVSTSAMAAISNPSLEDRAQAACYDDVQRLCAEAMPDVDRVTACMRTKRSQVSPKCAKMYKGFNRR